MYLQLMLSPVKSKAAQAQPTPITGKSNTSCNVFSFTSLPPPFADEIPPYSCSPLRPAHRCGPNLGNGLSGFALASRKDFFVLRIGQASFYAPPPLPAFLWRHLHNALPSFRGRYGFSRFEPLRSCPSGEGLLCRNPIERRSLQAREMLLSSCCPPYRYVIGFEP